MAAPKFHSSIRKYHRWTGFFLAGIIAVYASSGILLIFRSTDFLKYEQTEIRRLDAGLSSASLQQVLRLKGFRVTAETGDQIRFQQGSYNKASGEATITQKNYPVVLAKLVNLHKATTNSPLYLLNIGVGLCLLFFVISSFLMFIPKAAIYRNGIRIAATGFVFALFVVIFGS